MATLEGISYYLRKALLDHAFRNTVYTPPATVYVALFTTAPQEDGTGGVEVTGTGGTLYARQALAFNAATDPGQVLSTAEIQFPIAGASWGTVVGFGVYDAGTSGNLLAAGTKDLNGASISKTVGVNDRLTFPINQIKLAFANGS